MGHRSCGGADQIQYGHDRSAEGRRWTVHEAVPSLSTAFRKSALRRSYDPEDPAEVNQPRPGLTAIFLKVSAIHVQGRKDDDWHASHGYASISHARTLI